MNRCTALLVLALLLLGNLSRSQAQQAHVNLDWNPQANTQNLTPMYADVISPEVHDDQTVTFRVRVPGADEVLLSSYVLLPALGHEAPVPFELGDEGTWTLTIGPVPPNIYPYRLVIDGATVPDPNNTMARYANQPPYSQLVVHGDGPAFYDARTVPHGAVTRHIYHSDVTDGEREVYVYTPPGYDPTQTYPVLYLLGGSGELASTWSRDGRVNFIMDNLLAEGRVEPMVIVMPNNQVVHRRLPNHEAVTFDLFEDDLRQHIIPLIEAQYSVRTDPSGRALAGLSMGGRHTQFVGFRSLDLFRSFGVLSAGHVDTETLNADFLNDPTINDKIDYLFVGQGTTEARPDGRTEALHEALLNHGVDHAYYVGGGSGHDWITWRHLLYARFLPGLWGGE
jgi:enterochelin esterase family protein